MYFSWIRETTIVRLLTDYISKKATHRVEEM
jgi:hypothetical protein